MIPVESNAATDTSLHLRLTFAAQLPRRIEEIVRQVRALAVEPWNPRRVDFLHRLVHSLSSSAEAFGLPSLAAVARPLEMNLARLLGRTLQPKGNEVRRIEDSLDELVRVVDVHLASIALPLQDVGENGQDDTHSSLDLVLVTSGARIYAVRDIPEQARALQQILKDARYSAEVFSDVECLRLACQQQGWPQMILIDMVQVELESAALTMLSQMRASAPPQMQIVVVSARTEIQARLALYRAGANHYLPRPLQAESLLQLLERLFDQPLIEPYRALILGKDAAQLTIQCQLLQQAGLHVQTSTNINHVLSLLEKFDAEIVILDHDMGDLSCLLRDHNEGINLVFQHGGRRGDGEEAQYADAQDDRLPDSSEGTRFVHAVLARAQRQRKQQKLRLQLKQTRYERERESEGLNLHAIVSITDVSGKITYVNDKFCRISGYSRPELIGRNHRLLKSGQHGASFYQDLWRSVAHGHIWHGEICNRNKEGGLYWLDTTITPFVDAQGKPYQYLAIRTEVSAHKEQEKALQEAQRLARLRRTGADSVAQWQTYLHELFGAHGQQIEVIDEILSSEKEIDDVLHGVVRADGQVRYVRESGASRVSDDGRLLRAPGSIQDITNEHAQENEQDTQKMQAIAELAQRNGTSELEFLPNIRSQLRAPLHAVIAYLQWMRREHGGGSAALAIRHGLPEIAKTGQYLLSLVADVLDLARLEAGRMEIKVEPVSLQELFLACEAHTVALAAASSITLSFDLGPCVLCKVLGDAVRLKQTLLNLLNNAIKYNRPNGKVQINANFVSHPNGQRLQISVSDTGYGLSAEKLERLYTPFDRLDADQGKVKGTGLGLAISRQLLQLMGAQISVESNVGLGSTFTVEVSLAPEQFWHAALTEAPTEPQPNSARTNSSAQMNALLQIGGVSIMNGQQDQSDQMATPSARGDEAISVGATGRKVVLYIEDNAASQRLMYKVICKRPELELVEAMSAEHGLPLAESLQPALILLDINLPGIDGYEALNQLRKLPGLQEIPIVAVTANAMKGDAERGLAAGFTAYVAKPLDIEQFYALLDKLLAE